MSDEIGKCRPNNTLTKPHPPLVKKKKQICSFKRGFNGSGTMLAAVPQFVQTNQSQQTVSSSQNRTGMQKLNPTTFDNNDVLLVTGSTQLSRCVFDQTYLPILKKAIVAGSRIICGSAEGVDAHTRQVLIDENCKNHTVYVPSKAATKEKPTNENLNVQITKGGFKARDRQMQAQATAVLCFFSQYGAAASGAMANVLAVCLKTDGYDVCQHIRDASLPYNSAMACQTLDKEKQLFSNASARSNQ